jgi:Acetyltransferase (GNAT) domain
MNAPFHLPNDYSIHIAKSYEDTWKIFKLLVLKREMETNKDLNFYWVWLFSCGVLFCLAVFYFFSGYNTYLGLVITSFCVIIQIVFLVVFFNIVCLNIILAKNNCRQLTYISYQGKIIGTSLIAFHRNHSALLNLYICPSHRKKGVGSFLTYHILQGISNPVYVWAMPGSDSFYKYLGFVESQERMEYNMVYKFEGSKK